MTSSRLPTMVTIGVFLAMYALCVVFYPSMLSFRVAGNLLTDSAYLGFLVVGMTIVIVSGGIDLSVGAVMAFTSLFIAVAVTLWGWSPAQAFLAALIFGAGFGAAMGAAIHYLQAPAFIVTLTGMFLARGGAILISHESIAVDDPLYRWFTDVQVSLPGGGGLSLFAFAMIGAFVLGGLVLHRTRFGLAVFAMGGDRRAAELMGGEIGRDTIAVYAFSGLMAASAGIVFSLYTQSGYALSAVGSELEAIAAVVIGGALLSGGAGGMLGSFFGVMIQALILTYITFNGTLSSWWAKIAIGLIILSFLLLQQMNWRSMQARPPLS